MKVSLQGIARERQNGGEKRIPSFWNGINSCGKTRSSSRATRKIPGDGAVGRPITCRCGGGGAGEKMES